MAYTNGSATRPTTTDAVYSIALKIGRTLIEGARINSHYADFDKTPLEYGGIIEDLKIALKSSATFDPNETDLLAPSYDTIIKRYFGSWDSRRIDTEINVNVAKAVVTGEMQLSDFVAKCVNNLTESEKAETNDKYKALFHTEQTTGTAITDRLITTYANNTAAGGHLSDINGIINTSSYLPSGSCYEVFSKPTKDAVITEIRNIVKDMQYKNTTYQGVNTFATEAMLEDLRIVVPFKWLNDVDVTKLANVFNLEKADMLAKIVETDGCEFTYTDATATTGKLEEAHGFVIIIADRNALGRVVKGRDMQTQFVKERFTQWYGSLYDEMFYYNPLMKCWAIVFTDTETFKA